MWRKARGIQDININRSWRAVYGRVKKLTMPLSFEKRYQETYLDNIKVTVEGNGRKFETTTNEDGYYQVIGLAPGQYNVN